MSKDSLEIDVRNPKNIPGDFELPFIDAMFLSYSNGDPVIVFEIPFERFKILPDKILRIVVKVKRK